MVWSTHLDDGLADERVEVGHQFAVDVGHVQVLADGGDEAHGAVADPQVGVAQEGSCGGQRSRSAGEQELLLLWFPAVSEGYRCR